jgi:uridine kinase
VTASADSQGGAGGRARCVGICGGSGSGKTTLARLLQKELLPWPAPILGFDRYYRPLEHLPLHERPHVNFDHPDALDYEAFERDLDALCAGSRVSPPGYDFETHSRRPGSLVLEPGPLVIAEGILLLAWPGVVRRLDRIVFLDVPEETRLARRIARDRIERGRDEASVRRQFEASVAPMHERFVQSKIGLAHVIVRHGEDLAAVARELAAEERQALGTRPWRALAP